MENLINRAKEVIDRYADLEGYEDYEETEMLLEDAMNIISEFIDASK
jgi:hypothetical protein